MIVQNSRRETWKLFAIFALTCILISHSISGEESPARVERIHSEVDESSCICGLSKQILDKLESIIKDSQKRESSSCKLSSESSSSFQLRPQFGSTDNQNNGAKQPLTNPTTISSLWEGNWPGTSGGVTVGGEANYQNYRPAVSSSQTSPQIGADQKDPNVLSQLANEFQSYSSGLLQNTQKPIQNILDTASNGFGAINFRLPGANLNPVDSNARPAHTTNDQQASGSISYHLGATIQQQNPINSGFLQGLLGSNGANGLAKLNQSQTVHSSDMQSVLESTIPNLVSNIFSNIQNVTIETENSGSLSSQTGLTTENGNGLGIPSNVLTSIDGSTVQLNGNTTTEITAKGEELFMHWIEHQLDTLHLTASTANYIRKSALNLFRRIVRQYVERIERVGGRVEDNVKRATQIALNNTENLIAYILRNYINFAGGLMQIIGESVSRFGKRIDSTGETIANVNLNPFDIVSDVIASLPNPSRYSEYFRAFGKYLMGESSSGSSESNNNSNLAQQSQQQSQLPINQPERPQGMLSKAMGSIGKTLGFWMG